MAKEHEHRQHQHQRHATGPEPLAMGKSEPDLMACVRERIKKGGRCAQKLYHGR